MEDNAKSRIAGFKLASQGYNKSEIARRLKEPYSNICRWAKKYNWYNKSLDPLHQARVRLRHLIHKGNKTKRDFNEMDKLGELVIRFEEARSIYPDIA